MTDLIILALVVFLVLPLVYLFSENQELKKENHWLELRYNVLFNHLKNEGKKCKKK